MLFASSVLACCAFQGQRLWASSEAVPGGLIVHRSARAAPHRLIVHPNGATVVANQTQRFAVTDAQGKPVVVRWNVSGIGCSGSACGTISEDGVYQPPATLPKPGIVTVEGVLASNPNYSVLTEVRLEEAALAMTTANTIPPADAPRKAQPLAAPVIDRQTVARKAEMPPLQNAVAASPAIERRPVTRNNTVNLPPVATAIAAAPVIEKRAITRSGDIPLPGAIAAPPMVNAGSATRSGQLPLPNVIAAAPVVNGPLLEKKSGQRMPLPGAIAAPPIVEAKLEAKNSSRNPQMPLPNAVAAAPEVGRGTVHHSNELTSLQIVIDAAPDSGKKHLARAEKDKDKLLALPKAVPPVPNANVVDPGLARNPKTQEIAAVVRPPAVDFSQARTEQHTIPAPAISNVAPKPLLAPMQNSASPSSSIITAAGQRAPVTYANGQLTINAENMTLAAVLEMVAQKTGATIEVPPGTGQERIFEHAGPGRAEDVLASLLNGSPFDFVIVGSPQSPHVPSQVLLSLHKADDTPAGLRPQPAKTLVAASTWAPPQPAQQQTFVLTPDLDPTTIQAPKEPLDPEALGEMMKEKTKMLREQIQQQQQQQ
jgi:hypothetical protein